MLKAIIFSVILFYSCDAPSPIQNQGKSIDSLNRYSFYVYGFDGSVHHGTGFFYQADSIPILIVSKHLFANFTDSCRMRVDPITWRIYNLDTNKPGRSRNTPHKFTLNQEILCQTSNIIGLRIKKYAPLYVIKDEASDSLSSKIDSIYIFGFPRFESLPAIQFVKKGGVNLKLQVLKIDSFSTTSELSTFVVQTTFKSSAFSTNAEGFSGAPVFGKVATSNKWKFIGCWNSFDRVRHSIQIIPIRTLLLQLQILDAD